MNQEQNNLNQNNFNTQGNNGIPNNQPLQNNQNFNQGTNVNQPTFNQQPTPQPMNNTFDSGNASNQSFNSKPPKKMNLGLIIGIVATVAVVGVAMVFGSKLLSNSSNNNNNSTGNNASESSNTSNKDYSFDELKKDNENLHITNYVDFQLGYYFQYPINIDLSQTYRSRDYSAAVYRDETDDSLNSAFGDKSIKIIRIDLIKDFDNKSQEQILELLKFRYLGKPDEINYQKEFNNNNIKWLKYQFNIGETKDNYLYIAEYNDAKFAISFFEIEDDDISEVKNVNAVYENIIKSVKFSEKKELLKLKEASVLMYNTIYDTDSCLVYDELGNEIIANAYIPPTIYGISGSGAIAYKKTSDININNVINKLTTQNYPHRVLDVENNTYTIKKEEEVITLNESNIGDFQIKFYLLEQYSKEYNSTDILMVYVFVTNEYYGIVSNLANNENDIYQRSRLDYTTKNIVFNKELYNPSDFIEQ